MLALPATQLLLQRHCSSATHTTDTLRQHVPAAGFRTSSGKLCEAGMKGMWYQYHNIFNLLKVRAVGVTQLGQLVDANNTALAHF